MHLSVDFCPLSDILRIIREIRLSMVITPPYSAVNQEITVLYFWSNIPNIVSGIPLFRYKSLINEKKYLFFIDCMAMVRMDVINQSKKNFPFLLNLNFYNLKLYLSPCYQTNFYKLLSPTQFCTKHAHAFVIITIFA